MVQTPSYFTYYNKTYRIDATPEGGLTGHLLDLETGEFKENNRLIDTVLFNRAGEIDAVDEAEFIDATERERARYLRGDGPIFALYDTIKGLYDQAKSEGRRVTKDELALIKSLRRKTYQLWEDELARRAAGEPPTFRATTILG
ncbi:MAG: hypothetical protein QOI21_1283 [Actinomycetota bacterium]|jgi:hypothetical protein|nr:hypothetical protein [Actinomycetota bacterium]